MGFLTRCKRPFLFAFLLQFCNMLFSFFLKTFLILFEKQQPSYWCMEKRRTPVISARVHMKSWPETTRNWWSFRVQTTLTSMTARLQSPLKNWKVFLRNILNERTDFSLSAVSDYIAALQLLWAAVCSRQYIVACRNHRQAENYAIWEKHHSAWARATGKRTHDDRKWYGVGCLVGG